MLGTVKFITLEGAKKMAAAGEAEARRNGWNVGQRLAAPGDSSRAAPGSAWGQFTEVLG